MAERILLPTILVALWLPRIKDRLNSNLQGRGYFVLVARDKAHALEFVRIHSRPIHLMLSDGSTEGRILASTAKLYRQAMKVLFVSEDDQAAGADVVTPDQALAAISKLFATPEVPRRGMIAGATG